jgi:hypothetical protein
MRKLRTLPAGARIDLLLILTSPPDVRANAIRQFYERPDGRGLAEVLIDSEEDDVLRAALVDLLRHPSQA